MTGLWIAVFVIACIVPMVAWVWFTELRPDRDAEEE
jgi:hypothetical protein